jgi:hypothetical protein
VTCPVTAAVDLLRFAHQVSPKPVPGHVTAAPSRDGDTVALVRGLAVFVTFLALGAGAPAADAAVTRSCGSVFKDGFKVRVLATGASCSTGRAVARRYDVTRDRQTILRFRCTFVRRGLVRCVRGDARLRLELRGVE